MDDSKITPELKECLLKTYRRKHPIPTYKAFTPGQIVLAETTSGPVFVEVVAVRQYNPHPVLIKYADGIKIVVPQSHLTGEGD